MTDRRREALAFLNSRPKGVLATVSPEGRPKASMLLYAADDDFTIYFGTRKAFPKYAAILQNPAVSFVASDEGRDPLCCVEIQGEAHPLSETEQKEKLALLESKNGSQYFVKGADDFVMFALRPTSIKWLDGRSGELAVEEIQHQQ